MRSTLPSGNATRPTRSQPSGTAGGGRVPVDGFGHAALLTLMRPLARQAASKPCPQSTPQPRNSTNVRRDCRLHVSAADTQRRRDSAEPQRLDYVPVH
jgi:hypothetical protein